MLIILAAISILMLYCISYLECGNIPSILNGATNFTGKATYFVNDRINYTCDANFAAVNDSLLINICIEDLSTENRVGWLRNESILAELCQPSKQSIPFCAFYVKLYNTVIAYFLLQHYQKPQIIM